MKANRQNAEGNQITKDNRNQKNHFQKSLQSIMKQTFKSIISVTVEAKHVVKAKVYMQSRTYETHTHRREAKRC